MSQKSPEAFRTISEVAEELDVPQHVLRFWETKFAQVKPLKRGGGRRYYRPGDVDLLRGIKTLLYSEGYTIRGVQKVFRTQGVRYVGDVGQAGAQVLAAVNAPEVAAAPVEAEAAVQEKGAPMQLSLVEPAPLKLKTVERRQFGKRLEGLEKLKSEIDAVLTERAKRLAAEAPAARVAEA